MKLSAIFIGIGVTLIIFLVLIPLFIGSRITDDQGDNVGIFKSADGGLTWNLAVRSSEPTASLPRNVLSFAFHPKDADTIYLGTRGGGLWVSKNAGTTWARVTDAKGDLKNSAEVYGISVSEKEPDLMYLAAYQDNFGRVFRSTDGGISFDEVYITSAQNIHCSWGHPSDTYKKCTAYFTVDNRNLVSIIANSPSISVNFSSRDIINLDLSFSDDYSLINFTTYNETLDLQGAINNPSGDIMNQIETLENANQ